MSPITLGPLVLPFSAIIVIVAFAVSLVIVKRLATPDLINPSDWIWRGLMVGLIAARAGFVLAHFKAYATEPLQIVALGDGGWNPMLGVLAVWVYGFVIVTRTRSLRKPIMGALIGMTVTLGLGHLMAATSQVEHATRLANTPVPALEGEPVDLSVFLGKPVVVNLWATWCGPCRREMPAFQHAQQERQDVHFVFLNQGESAEQVKSFLATQGLTLHNVFLDRRQAMGPEYGRILPTTLFFDAGGHLLSVRSGGFSRATLEHHLRTVFPATDQ